LQAADLLKKLQASQQANLGLTQEKESAVNQAKAAEADRVEFANVTTIRVQELSDLNEVLMAESKVSSTLLQSTLTRCINRNASRCGLRVLPEKGRATTPCALQPFLPLTRVLLTLIRANTLFQMALQSVCSTFSVTYTLLYCRPCCSPYSSTNALLMKFSAPVFYKKKKKKIVEKVYA
jgi:hypothetical protein